MIAFEAPTKVESIDDARALHWSSQAKITAAWKATTYQACRDVA